MGNSRIISEPVNKVILVGTLASNTQDGEIDNNEVVIPKIYLDSFSLSGGELDKIFIPKELNYKINLKEDANYLVFEATSDNPDATIDGLGEIDAHWTKSHTIKISVNSDNYTQYHFTWDNTSLDAPVDSITFLFNGKLLTYDSQKTINIRGLEKYSIIVNDEKLNVYKDDRDNKLIALKDKDNVSSWYLIDDENIIQKEVDSPFSGNGIIYHKTTFMPIDDDLLEDFNISPTNIDIIKFDGYAINKQDYDSIYFVRLATLDGEDSWYSLNSVTSEIKKLYFDEKITRANLDDYFESQVIVTDVKVSESNTNEMLVGILVVSVVAMLALAIGFHFRNRKSENKK